MTIFRFDVLVSQLGTSPLFHVQFWLLLPDLHTDLSRGRWGSLVFPSVWEISTVCGDPHKGFEIVNKAEIDVILELSCFLDNPVDVSNLISGSSAFTKTSSNIWKFMVHVLLKPGMENFEHAILLCEMSAISILWHFLSLGLEWKLTFSSPVATAEFSRFAGILSV